MRSDLSERARELAQELVGLMDTRLDDLERLTGEEGAARLDELVTWLSATLAGARRELAPPPAGEDSRPTSLLKDVLFVVDLLAHENVDAVTDVEVAALATPYIRGDRWTVRRTLLNVLLDARMAEPRGGKLRVEVSIEGGNALLRVKKLPLAGSGRVAKPGASGDAPTPAPRCSTPPPGSATPDRTVNLIRAARILASISGGLAVESELGRGTTVTIRLPLVASRPLPPPGKRPKPPERGEDAGRPRGTPCPKNEPTSPYA